MKPARETLVLPVTHTPPSDPADAIEIPPATKRRLGLDHARLWILLTEANRFRWPGPDLRPTRAGDASSVVFGESPGDLFNKMREKWLARIDAHRSIVPRSE